MINVPWENITAFGQQTLLDSKLFNISWILGRFCNYKCSYCWPYANSQTLDHQELEVYIKTFDEIRAQASHNGFTSFHWSFSGGEPTAYKHFLEIASRVLLDSTHMTTNLSPGIQWWERWLVATNLSKRRSITASFHHEFADEQAFEDKILMLMQNNVLVTVNQVMVPELFYNTLERCSRLRSKGINVTLKPQSDPTASKVISGYTDDMLKIMQDDYQQSVLGENIYQVRLTDGTNNYYIDQAERFNAFGFNQFQGWTCNAGYQSIIIRGNEVKRAYSCRDEKLGTLTEGFKIFENPKVCITKNCVSSADSKIPKSK